MGVTLMGVSAKDYVPYYDIKERIDNTDFQLKEDIRIALEQEFPDHLIKEVTPSLILDTCDGKRVYGDRRNFELSDYNNRGFIAIFIVVLALGLITCIWTFVPAQESKLDKLDKERQVIHADLDKINEKLKHQITPKSVYLLICESYNKQRTFVETWNSIRLICVKQGIGVEFIQTAAMSNYDTSFMVIDTAGIETLETLLSRHFKEVKDSVNVDFGKLVTIRSLTEEERMDYEQRQSEKAERNP